ncbi:hypothetical protein MKW94_014835 [Papaver nudicaule]|uniref:C2 domain-containing protein n=1 Tax=Papaver nudicaule TaxID=74823 RepID=A0AA41SGQ2_PAPNU|nr:hypothetical protein [Papaver nudicaule]
MLNFITRNSNILICKMDPYVVIQFGNQRRKSTVARGEGRAPLWNEKFTFDVEYPADNVRDEHHQYKLNFTIMDKDRFSRDDFVGESTIYVRDVISLGVQNGTSEIRASTYRVVLHNKTYSGEIRIGLSFTREVCMSQFIYNMYVCIHLFKL